MKNKSVLLKLLCIVFIFFFAIIDYSYAFTDIPKQFLTSPALLLGDIGDNKVSTGSGFFMNYGKNVYFITARHVLFKESTVTLAELPQNFNVPKATLYRISYDANKKQLSFDGRMSAEIRDELLALAGNNKLLKDAIEELYTKSQELNLKFNNAQLISYSPISDKEKNIFMIDTKELYRDKNIQYHKSKDIAAIKIGESEQTKDSSITKITVIDGVRILQGSDILNLTEANTLKYDDVIVGNTVYTFGYPTSISNKNAFLDIQLPLLRKGVVAGKNDLLKLIILDSPVYYGNSGGLVVEVVREPLKETSYAVGIITNLIPFMRDDSKGYDNSGYSVAVPIDDILNLLTR